MNEMSTKLFDVAILKSVERWASLYQSTKGDSSDLPDSTPVAAASVY
jgi:hypothetical protein